MIKNILPNYDCAGYTIKVFQLLSFAWHTPIKEDAINKEVENIICCKNSIEEELLHRILQDNNSDDEWLTAKEKN
jgi:hypothetical protein